MRPWVRRPSLPPRRVLAASSSEKVLLKPRDYDNRSYTANDQINIGLIGSGIRGILDMRFALGRAGC